MPVTETFQREVVHTPQIGVPVASDGVVRVALVIDNPGNAPAFGLVWQSVDTPIPEEWSWVGVTRLWQLFEDNKTLYTHVDGRTFSGTRKEVQAHFGADAMIFDWLPKMNQILRDFFGLDQEIDPESIDALFANMRELTFESGQIVRK